MAATLTSRTLALARLVRDVTALSMPVPARDTLTAFLLDHLTAPHHHLLEPTFAALVHDLAAAGMPHDYLAAYCESMRAVVQPDDVWDLVDAVSALVEPPGAVMPRDSADAPPLKLERTSVFGLFARRVALAFERATFEELCSVTARTRCWVHEGDGNGESTPASDAPAPPPWTYVTPAPQLRQLMHALIRQSEEGMPIAPPPPLNATTTPQPPAPAGDDADGLAAWIEQLLRFAPEAPHLAHLQMRHHAQKGQVDEALECFHRYFDYLGEALTSRGGAVGASVHARRDEPTSLMQWSGLSLAWLYLELGQHDEAFSALHECMRIAQQNDDSVCLAHALLGLAYAQGGSGGDAPKDLPADSPGATPERSTHELSLLRQCVNRANMLELPELARLASEALAMRTSVEAGLGARGGEANSQPPVGLTSVSATAARRTPPLLPPMLGARGVLFSLGESAPPPLCCWEALRAGADGRSNNVRLVSAALWERFGERRLAELHAALQIAYYRPAAVAAAATGGAIGAGAMEVAAGAQAHSGSHQSRLEAACKLGLLRVAQRGEAAAIAQLLALRDECRNTSAWPAWLTSTCLVLLRGALERRELLVADELLRRLKSLITATNGPNDEAWQAELDLLIKRGLLTEAISRADELKSTSTTGRFAGGSYPMQLCALASAQAHALGGEPINALPHALAAIGLCEGRGLRAHCATAAVRLAEVQVEVDATRALELLEKTRAYVLQAGSSYDVATLQLLTARCRLAELPPYEAEAPPTKQQLRTYILPALEEAANAFASLHCYHEVAEASYHAARAYHTVGSDEERNGAAQAYVTATAAANAAKERLAGELVYLEHEGVLERHLDWLKRPYPGLL